MQPGPKTVLVLSFAPLLGLAAGFVAYNLGLSHQPISPLAFFWGLAWASAALSLLAIILAVAARRREGWRAPIVIAGLVLAATALLSFRVHWLVAAGI